MVRSVSALMNSRARADHSPDGLDDSDADIVDDAVIDHRPEGSAVTDEPSTDEVTADITPDDIAPSDDAAGDAAASDAAVDADGAAGDAADDSPDDSDVPDGSDAEERPTLTRRQGVMFAAVVLLIAAVVAAGAAAGWLLLQHKNAGAAHEREQSVMDTAGRVAADLVTLRASSADDDIKRIQDSSTGEFRQQIGDSTGGFAAVLKQGAVESTGKASQLAMVENGENHSVVLAAVTSTLKNSETTEPQQRVYRMRLTLDRADSKWLVSKVEFVA